MAGMLITVDQPARRHRRRRRPAGHAFADAVQHFSLLTVGDGLCRADPGAADLGRHRHHRHPLRRHATTSARRRHADPRPAQGAAGRRRDGHRLRPRAGPAEDPVLHHRRPSVRHRLDAQGQAELRAGRGGRAREGRGRAGRRPGASCPRRATPALEALALDPLELAIGFGLVPLVDAQAGGTLLARVGTIRRQIASELGMVIPAVRIRDDVSLDSHEYVMQRAWHGSCARRRDGGPPSGHGPGRRHGPAAGHPDHRARVRPARGVDPRLGPRRGRGARLDRGRRRVGGRHAPHRDDPQPRRRAAHPPGDAPRCSTSSRTSTRPSSTRSCRTCSRSARSSACCSRCCARASRSATSAPIARGDRRQGPPHARPGDARRVRPPGARPHDRRAVPRRRGHAARRSPLDPQIEQEMAEALVQTADGEFLAMDPARAARHRRLRRRAGRDGDRHAAGGPCCCARRACAATCARCASSGCRSSRSARTTRSRRVSG